jgi:P4 family phage/plasmid primase-like protien
LFATDIELEYSLEQCNQQPKDWICFQNGYYSLIDRQMKPHDPKYRTTNMIPHTYQPQAQLIGTKTEKYFKSAFNNPDTLKMTLQYACYCLTPDTRFQVFAIIDGIGGTGKSVFLGLLGKVVGADNISNISLDELSTRFASYGLLGKLLNLCSELEIEALSDFKTLKMASGEDIMRGEAKGKNAISFKSYAKLIFSTNQLPIIKGETTNAIYRRLIIIPMNYKPKSPNPNLSDELENEIDYFIHRLVQAGEELYREGKFTISSESIKAVEQLRADSDTVQSFLNEYCDIKDGNVIENRTLKTTLFDKYCAVCEQQERQKLTRNNFYKSLRSKGFNEGKDSKGDRCFKGIVLRSTPRTADDEEEQPSKTAVPKAEEGFLDPDQYNQEELPFD